MIRKMIVEKEDPLVKRMSDMLNIHWWDFDNNSRPRGRLSSPIFNLQKNIMFEGNLLLASTKILW